MLIWLSVAAAVVAGFLCWNLSKRFRADRISALIEKRRATARLVSSGEFVDGNRHMKVALALTDSDLYYENEDMEASLELRWIREIQYDTSLATGKAVAGGEVLRLRCFSQAFEFIVPKEAAARWHALLPPGQPEAASAATELAARVAVAT
jgi:hypothetical protein